MYGPVGIGYGGYDGCGCNACLSVGIPTPPAIANFECDAVTTFVDDRGMRNFCSADFCGLSPYPEDYVETTCDREEEMPVARIVEVQSADIPTPGKPKKKPVKYLVR